MAPDIPIYVINLDRSPGRLEHARSELSRQGLGFIRVPAVDARALRPEEIAAAFDAERSARSYYAPMHAGEIACFLSHRLAWRRFLGESAAPFALVFEDDFALRGSLPALIESLRAGTGLPPWDMIKLWSRPKSLREKVAPLPEGRHLVRHRVLPTLMLGQAVSRAGAEKLLAGTLPFHRPVDVQMQYWWELGLRIWSVDPPLAVDASRSIGGSDLQPAAPVGLGLKLRREIGRIAFRSVLFAKSAWHERQGR